MEIDSLCYPLRLAYQYWKVTGDSSIFDGEWMKAITAILKTFKEQQRKDGVALTVSNVRRNVLWIR